MGLRIPPPCAVVKLHRAPADGHGDGFRVVAVGAVTAEVDRIRVIYRVRIIWRLAVVDILLPDRFIAGAGLAVHQIADFAALELRRRLRHSRCLGAVAAAAKGACRGSIQIVDIGKILCGMAAQITDNRPAVISAAVLHRAVVIAVADTPAAVVDIP